MAVTQKPGTSSWKVVAIGGGTGLPVVLSGLKRYLGSSLHSLTAVVTVADEGGSSGRLRAEYDILPPGDIRNCLVALADVEPLMAQLFQYRFSGNGTLGGHNFGNLFLTALTHVTGDFLQAIKVSSKILAVRGTILPSTLDKIRLGAECSDGTVVMGESEIAKAGKTIKRVFLDPRDCRPLSETLEAIGQADMVVFSPGSLYTSLLPNLLVSGIADALRSTAALKVYVANLMTEPGETDGYTLSDHLATIVEHAGAGVVDGVVVNAQTAGERTLTRYAESGAYPIVVDIDRVRKWGVWVARADLIGAAEKARHHAQKVGQTLIGMLSGKTEKE